MGNQQGHGKIEWCDRTVNVVHGCTPILDLEPSACERCYAKRMATRLAGRAGYPADEPFRVTVRPDRLAELLKARPGERVFVPSMGDLFHDDVPDEFIAAVFGCFASRPDVTYIVLTKRPARARRWFGIPEIAKRVDLMKHVALAGRVEEVFAEERIIAVSDWPGYFVTSKGRVLSDRDHGGNRTSIVHDMIPTASDSGHCSVSLYRDGVQSRVLVHRMVLEAFDSTALNDAQACHIDSDPGNNNLWNLRWGTQTDNWDDSKRHGTRRRYSKLTEDQVIQLRRDAIAGVNGEELGRRYSISATQARNIVTGRQWGPEYTPEWPLHSVWLLATCESQHWLEQRIVDLLECPAVVHGISVEGMLGPVDLPAAGPFADGDCLGDAFYWNGAGETGAGLDWVICGAEQGPGARPFDPAWARNLRDQCRDAGVPFFFKKLAGRADPPAELFVRQWPRERR